MLGSLLVPLDGSALADGVLPHVERLAMRNQGKVHLLRVTAEQDSRRDERSRQDEEAATREHLRATRARLEELGLQVEVHVAQGDPATEILSAARRLTVGLIVMASHGRGGLARWLRGSVAEGVLREASTPLLLLSAHGSGEGVGLGLPARIRRILVPLDGGERSATIIPYVIVLAQEVDAEVVLVRVEWPGLQEFVGTSHPMQEVVDSLAPWRARLESAGLKVRVLALQGDAAAEILDTAEREEADLVALATHGRTGLGRLLDGSVAEKVLRHCRRPLLLVRAPGRGTA